MTQEYSAMAMSQNHVLLSGGIGSGKSTVATLLRERGWCVIDADEVGHEILEPGAEGFQAVAERFPNAVVEGRIDRRRLAAEVFSQPDRLRLLESITHSLIRDRVRRLFRACVGRHIAVEVPLASDFLGKGWRRVVVDAPEDVRVARLRDRGMDEEDALRRMRLQPSRDEWLAFADVVIDNSGDRKALEAEVDRVLSRLES